MLEVDEAPVTIIRAIQNLGKSDHQLMKPRTPSFLTTLDSKHVKHLCPDKWTFESLCELQ